MNRTWGGLRLDSVTWFLVVLFSYWWFVKYQLFRGLEYTSDLFTFIQLSNSWVHSRPILFENQYGYTTEAHNYIASLFFGPLTELFGAYGLFAGLLILLFIAARRSLLFVDRGVEGWTARRIVLASFLVGPVGFWFWDHPIYGFHLELLFLPLGILYALAIFDESGRRWLWLILICLIREEGPLLAFSIHLFVVFWKTQQQQTSARLATFLRLATRLGLLYGVIFGLEMASIWLHRGYGTGRLNEAVGRLYLSYERGALEENLYLSLVSCGLLMLPVCAAVLLQGRSIATILSLGAALAPMVAITAVAGLYYVDIRHGMTWQPRFVLIWTVGLAGMLVTTRHPGLEAAGNRRWPAVAAVALAICYYSVALWGLRGYPVWDRVTTVSESGLLVSRLTQRERQILDCLAVRLPRDTFIATSGEIFGKFHRYPIVWPNRVESAWKPPEIVICDEGKRLYFEFFGYNCGQLLESTLGTGFTEGRFDEFRVSYSAKIEGPVGQCLSRASLP